jgi:hypothetical protein
MVFARKFAEGFANILAEADFLTPRIS